MLLSRLMDGSVSESFRSTYRNELWLFFYRISGFTIFLRLELSCDVRDMLLDVLLTV